MRGGFRRSNLAVSGAQDSERCATTASAVLLQRALCYLQRDCHASFAEPHSARNDKGDCCHCEEPCDEAISRSLALRTASAVLLQRALCYYSEIATPRSQSLSRLAMTIGDGCHCEEPCDEAISQSTAFIDCEGKEASPLIRGHFLAVDCIPPFARFKFWIERGYNYLSTICGRVGGCIP